MNSRVLDPRCSAPQARSNLAIPAAWKREDAFSRGARDSRLATGGQASPPDPFRRLEDRQFLEMSRCFGIRGGWVTGDEMSRRLRRHWDQPISVLANWVTKREIVNVAWRSGILIPVFQFDTQDSRVRPVVPAALAELEGVFDDWEIAVWFAQPNAWLDEQRSLEVAAWDDDAVVQAALADRFIACN